MTVGVIATIKVQKDRNSEFETVFGKLAVHVLDNEKGCTFYALHRSKTDPQIYKVLEQYKTMQDLTDHGKTEYFLAAAKAMGGLLGAAPEIELLDGV
jgi:quinol monooxygenase YgiN